MEQQTIALVASAWFTSSLNAVKPAAEQVSLEVAVYADASATWPGGGIPQKLFACVQVGESQIRVRNSGVAGVVNVQEIVLGNGQPAWEGEFLLQAGTSPIVSGTKISVLFVQGNAPVGKIDVDLTDHPEWRRMGTIAVSTLPPASPDFVFYVRRRPPVWLDLAVSCAKTGGAGLLLRELESFVDLAFDQGSTGLSALMKKFWKLTGGGAAATRAAALSLGQALWDMLPDDLHTFYGTDATGTGAMRDRPDATVQVSSDEWHVPWEFVTPPPHGGQQPRNFGARYAISRWKHGQAAAGSIPISNVAVIAPGIRDTKFGPEVARLRTYAHSLGASVTSVTAAGTQHTTADGTGPADVPGKVSFKDVDRLFLPPSPQVIHIRTHGWPHLLEVAPDTGDPTVRLSLWLDEVRQRGPVFRTARRPPFVFLNACSTAAGAGDDLSSLQTGGWPEALYMSGSAAFVATYSVVLLTSAKKVAERFYNELAAGKSFAHAMQKIRNGFYDDPESDDDGSSSKPTYLAYTVCGHPHAKLVIGGLDPDEHDDPPG